MRNTRTRLIAVAALGTFAAAPIAAHACAQYGAASTAQASDPALAMVRQIEAQMNAPFGGDLVGFIDWQEAAMNAMFQQIDAIMAHAVGSPGAIQVAVPSGANGALSTIMISTVSNGQGVCSETVTYADGPDGQLRVSVQTTGNACGNATGGTGQTPIFTSPQPAPQAPHTIQINGPARPVQRYVRG